MLPAPLSRITGTACLQQYNDPRRLTCSTSSHSSVVVSSSVALGNHPALFTSPSTFPKLSSVFFTSPAHSFSFFTSVLQNSTLPPPLRIFVAASSALSCCTSASITAAPSDAIRLAHPNPIPCAAPVTITTFPPSRLLIVALPPIKTGSHDIRYCSFALARQTNSGEHCDQASVGVFSDVRGTVTGQRVSERQRVLLDSQRLHGRNRCRAIRGNDR